MVGSAHLHGAVADDGELHLVPGAALAEFADRPWALAEAARLEELRLAAQEALAELRLAGGGHAELVGELEALVATQPLRERRWGRILAVGSSGISAPLPNLALSNLGRAALAGCAMALSTAEVLAMRDYLVRSSKGGCRAVGGGRCGEGFGE